MHEARNPVKSVQTTLALIEVIQEREEVGVTELAETLDLTKGTVHCHLATLEQNGYVVNSDGRYKLGLKFVDLGNHIRHRRDIYGTIGEEIEKLADRTGELALFTVEEQYGCVCLHKSSGENAVETDLFVDYRNQPDWYHHTAVGKAILAFKSEDEIDEILAQSDLKPLTDHTITDEAELREELSEIRDSGMAFNRGETIPGMTGVGAPIRDQDGSTYGAISVVGPTTRMKDEQLEDIAEKVNQTVNIIELNATSL